MGQPTTNIARILDRVLNRAGIERHTPDGKVDVHGLRHCAASKFARAGVPIVQTAHILGHASIEMTSRVYVHVALNDLRAAVDAIGSSSRSAALRVVSDGPVPSLRDHGALA